MSDYSQYLLLFLSPPSPQDAINNANARNNDDDEKDGEEDEEEDDEESTGDEEEDESEDNATLQAAKVVLENRSLEDRTQSKRLKYSAVAGVADGTSGHRMDHSLPSGLDAMANYSHTGSEDEEADLMKRPCLDRRPNWSKDEDNWTKRPCVDRLWV